MSLASIQRSLIQYGIGAYFALGIVGNICNCIMFTRPSYRRTPSSWYFLFLSIFGLFYLLWGVSVVFYSLNYTDPQTQSIVFCKVRLYGSHIVGQCLRYFVVFACIDRYIVTQSNVRIRAFSSVSNATKSIFTIISAWVVISLHIPVYLELRQGVCGMFGVYKLVHAIYSVFVTGLLPPALMIVFGILTMRNLRRRHDAQIRARRRDRHLMRMLIAEVATNILTSVPYSVNLIYSAATYYVDSKSSERREIESFVTFLTQFLIYLLSAAPFYLFIAASKPFRCEFVGMFVQCWKKHIVRRVQIVPSLN